MMLGPAIGMLMGGPPIWPLWPWIMLMGAAAGGPHWPACGASPGALRAPPPMPPAPEPNLPDPSRGSARLISTYTLVGQ